MKRGIVGIKRITDRSPKIFQRFLAWLLAASRITTASARREVKNLLPSVLPNLLGTPAIRA
ncbi:hypothetical protein I551_5098 [Mycobacterium ulcerans str. Harvey]|uniref:Uncharacterized protein n=1 Tax=Mycobacterium ulcerans str. Harvey TaxID=1299332 RepID=A0ABN0QV64_MYCUL|nr:hypothetical protein I551_5098 [Mycobacterium ulcerans str. Harvey]OIN18341.1 hypothetical protein A3649_14910 [Mycobacterium ulcerans]